MTLTLLCRALALAAYLLFALAIFATASVAQESGGESAAEATGEPPAEAVPSAAPVLPGLEAARALVDAGRFADALTILQVLAQDHPDHPRRTDILFLYGLSATQLSQRPGLPE